MKMKVMSKRPQWLFPALTVGLIVILVAIALFNTIWYARVNTGQIIVKDLEQLSAIFKKIDASCGITGFDYVKNHINFLTVKKDGFVGSEIGSMNLRNSTGWEGPYVQDNLHVQGKEYMVVKTQKGYFITPGDDVKLPNGKVIGKDIILDENTDIAAMTRNEQQLLYKGSPLAVALPIYGLGALDVPVQPIFPGLDD